MKNHSAYVLHRWIARQDLAKTTPTGLATELTCTTLRPELVTRLVAQLDSPTGGEATVVARRVAAEQGRVPAAAAGGTAGTGPGCRQLLAGSRAPAF